MTSVVVGAAIEESPQSTPNPIKSVIANDWKECLWCDWKECGNLVKKTS